MRKTKHKLFTGAVCGLCALLLAANGGMVRKASAHARYCDDGYYEGSGTRVSTDYTIEYDSYVEHNEYYVYQAPSLHNGGTGATNCCSSKAGTNVIAFYDRYYTNLIEDFEPGMEYKGIYRYFPNIESVKIPALHTTLYNYMNVNVNYPGATEDDFKSGLKRYVNEQGYNVNYKSAHQNAKMVNLTKIQQMVNNNQVAVLCFSGYNFVYGFTVASTYRKVYQEAVDAGHMMMVYGYFTVDYYKNGRLFLTETYLQASMCNGLGDQGFIKMNDYGNIDDAFIVEIS